MSIWKGQSGSGGKKDQSNSNGKKYKTKISLIKD